MAEALNQNGRWPPWLKTVVVGRHPRRTLWRIAALCLTCFVVFHFVLLPVRVEGISMWPAYQSHRLNFVNRLAYARHPPRRGHVVCIQFEAGRHRLLLKRVLGLPGETVEFRHGQFFINGQPLDEPYVRTRCYWNEPKKRLGPDEYYVAGDNRAMAATDHVHGVTDGWKIVGKVLL